MKPSAPGLPGQENSHLRVGVKPECRNWLKGQRIIAFQRSYVEVAGSVQAALMLSQAVFWAERAKDPAGWFFMSHRDWLDQIGLTRHEQITARRQLRGTGIWEEAVKGVPATVWYRVRVEVLRERVGNCSGPVVRKADNWFAAKRTTGSPESAQHLSLSEISTERAQRAAPARSCQDAVSAAPSAENGERQFVSWLRKVASEKSFPSNGRPTDPLKAELYDGIYRRKVEDAFFDCQRLPFREQVQGCVGEATTGLVLNRVARLKTLRAEQIEVRAITKLQPGLAALQAVGDFSRRRDQTVAAVIRAVVESAAELLGAAGGDREPSRLSTAGTQLIEASA